MPWSRALNDDERAQLLALIRKMLSAEDKPEDLAGAGAPADAATAAAVLAAAGMNPLGTLEGVPGEVTAP
jgi:UDP-N-acetylenolpyruvoylglucosamine reductase